MCSDAGTSEYIVKRVSEGKSKREAMRCPKRYIAREACRALMSPTAARHAAGPSLAARRKRAGLLQRDVAARLGIRPTAISGIETESAKHIAERDAYEAFLNGVEKRTQVDNKRSVIAGTTSIRHMLSAQSSIPQSL